MRRSMLTASRAPFKAGLIDSRYTASPDDQFNAIGAAIQFTSGADFTAPLNGVLTGVKMKFWSGTGNIAIMVADPATLVLRSISENIAVTSGAEIDYNFATPLTVQAGDMVGLWCDKSAGGTVNPGLRLASVSTGDVWYRSTSVLKPPIGADLDGSGYVTTTLGADSYALHMQVRGLA